MTQAFIGVGSNIDKEKSIRTGVARLRERFGRLLISTVYESPAYGFEGDNFYNLIVALDTDMDPLALSGELHAIEESLGRKRDEPRYSPRILDLDLLLYGDLICHGEGLDIPRGDIRKFSFVLKPLAEIAGGMRHPETGATFEEMWRAFDQAEQNLWPVELPGLYDS
ncbi:MAG: 2-amino-4-hydroxy-6-hydroxymethyldihydropteridine diphosphokinase [Gammaproteobacteria bacterium]|jgi:2-amino-4-hydroxy-6-hydroxymethyldihydropteridine diphosphokinase